MSLPPNPYTWITAAVFRLSAIASPQGPRLCWASLQDKTKNRLDVSLALAGHRGGKGKDQALMDI